MIRTPVSGLARPRDRPGYTTRVKNGREWVERVDLVILVSVHHLDGFLTRDQFCLARTEIVFTRRDLFPALVREFRMFHSISGSVTEELTPGIEPLFLPRGVSVQSSKLSADTDGETKTTVEHEYQITDDVFDACECLYALSYYEANEESFDRLQ